MLGNVSFWMLTHVLHYVMILFTEIALIIMTNFVYAFILTFSPKIILAIYNCFGFHLLLSYLLLYRWVSSFVHIYSVWDILVFIFLHNIFRTWFVISCISGITTIILCRVLLCLHQGKLNQEQEVVLISLKCANGCEINFGLLE